RRHHAGGTAPTVLHPDTEPGEALLTKIRASADTHSAQVIHLQGRAIALRCVAAATAARRPYHCGALRQANPSCRSRANPTARSIMDFGAHSIIWIILVGLVIGAIEKLLMPCKDLGGCIVTILLGIGGALVH